MSLEVIPAILVKTKEQLLEYINKVKSHVNSVHIDVMDGKFVPNNTVTDFSNLPKDTQYEFHWMVKDPENWIPKSPKNALHLVHIETISTWKTIEKATQSVDGTIGIVINPETPIEKAYPYVGRVKRFLLMTVHPGFDGQKYLPEVEAKIKKLRAMDPTLEIEVDGGVKPETAETAVASGANILAAASAIFKAPNIANAIHTLKNTNKGVINE